MDKFLIAVIINLVIAVCSFAQSAPGLSPSKTVRIEGNVRNGKSEPIEFVTVILQQLRDSTLVAGTTTNASGNFSFDSIAPGKYLMTLTFIGYQKHSNTIELLDGISSYTVSSIILQNGIQILGEVAVRGQKALIHQEGNKLILNVQNSIIAVGGSVAEFLERAPGVRIDQNDQISLNGKTGVTIMIDGKITYLPPTELATLLRSMNANNIASVEVITNPTARYDAAGNSGIINIKTKKSTSEGFHGSATMGAGYGRYGKANGNINFNYRTKKWSHFINYGYTFNKQFNDFITERVSLLNSGQPFYYTQQFYRIRSLPSHTWQAGSEWQWNPKNSIALSTSGSSNTRNTDNTFYTQLNSDLYTEPDSTYTLTNNQPYRWYNISSSIGYKHLFPLTGNELSVDVDYSNYEFKLNDNFNIDQFRQQGIFVSNYKILSDQTSSINIYTMRMDYTHRIKSQTSLEVGIKLSHVKTVNEIFFTDNKSGQFETDLTRSTDFDYTEKIGASYVNMKTKLLRFDAQLGLRAEQTIYDGFSLRSQKSIRRNYFRLFPNISLTRSINENYQFGLAYNYRIDRPNYNDLYPFVFYIDPFSAQKGNPTLLPQFTHSLQFTQTIAKKYIFNLGYNVTSQYIGFLIVLNQDRISEFATKQNFKTFQNYYLNANVPVKISKNWAVNSNLNLFYNHLHAKPLDKAYNIRLFSGMATISQTITLPWGLTSELTTVYNGPSASGLFKVKALGSVNVGLQKKVLDKKGTIRLNVTDIFYTNKSRNSVVIPGLDMHFNNYPETRIVRFNFTYNIGTTGKISRRRNAQEDEQKRIGIN